MRFISSLVSKIDTKSEEQSYVAKELVLFIVIYNKSNIDEFVKTVMYS